MLYEVITGGQYHCIGLVTLYPAVDQVAGDDAAGTPVTDHEIKHLAAGMQAHTSIVNLPVHCPVGAEQQLLPGLAFRIKGTRHQYA